MHALRRSLSLVLLSAGTWWRASAAEALVLHDLQGPHRLGFTQYVLVASASGDLLGCNYDACANPHVLLDFMNDGMWHTQTVRGFQPGGPGEPATANVQGNCVPDPNGAGRWYRTLFVQTVRDAPLFIDDTAEASAFLSCPTPK